MSTENRPSKRQRELLSYIDGFIKGHGYGPSYREVMRALNYKSVSTVAIHVDNLIKKGHLRKRDHSARSLEVINGAAEFSGPPQVNKSQQKWLVDAIVARFTAIETSESCPAQHDIDDLYVLVGALQILGLQDAATSLKARLFALIK